MLRIKKDVRMWPQLRAASKSKAIYFTCNVIPTLTGEIVRESGLLDRPERLPPSDRSSELIMLGKPPFPESPHFLGRVVLDMPVIHSQIEKAETKSDKTRYMHVAVCVGERQ